MQKNGTDKSSAQEAMRRSIAGNQLVPFAWVGVLVISLMITAGLLTLIGSLTLIGTLAFSIPVFLLLVTLLSAFVEGKRRAKDRLAHYTATIFFLIALVPLGSLVYEVVTRGTQRFDFTFFTQTQMGAHLMEQPMGGLHALLGSAIVTLIATLISVPIGLFTAIYLVEYGNTSKLAFGIRFFVDVMTGIPSIVAGLFAYALFSLIFGAGTKIGMGGAVALSVLMIPTIVRSTEEMLKLVPNELREASYALGVPKWRTILKVVLPTSLAGIITGVVLGIARIIGETAPLLVTAGYFIGVNTNPFSSQMATLPVFVYQSLRDHSLRAEELALLGWTGALILILTVMLLNLIGRLIAWKFAPKPGR